MYYLKVDNIAFPVKQNKNKVMAILVKQCTCKSIHYFTNEVNMVISQKAINGIRQKLVWYCFSMDSTYVPSLMEIKVGHYIFVLICHGMIHLTKIIYWYDLYNNFHLNFGFRGSLLFLWAEISIFLQKYTIFCL